MQAFLAIFLKIIYFREFFFVSNAEIFKIRLFINKNYSALFSFVRNSRKIIVYFVEFHPANL